MAKLANGDEAMMRRCRWGLWLCAGAMLVLVTSALAGRLPFSSADWTWTNLTQRLVERPVDRLVESDRAGRVIEDLRQGGYVVYFRHASTDRSQQDSEPENLANCATQRNLTDAGRAQARAIGEAFRALNIPVGRVLSSEYCRALEHARLSFGSAVVEPSLVLPEPLTAEERRRNVSSLTGMLAVPPPKGTNTVMVSHSTNLREAVGVDLLTEGEAVIFRPTAGATSTVLARMLPGDWEPLSQAFAPH